jgi:hypothetical protein
VAGYRLPGGHSLVHHVDATVGERTCAQIDIIGEPDPLRWNPILTDATTT